MNRYLSDLFLMVRTILSCSCSSPVINMTVSTMCSSIRGPATTYMSRAHKYTTKELEVVVKVTVVMKKCKKFNKHVL